MQNEAKLVQFNLSSGFPHLIYSTYLKLVIRPRPPPKERIQNGISSVDDHFTEATPKTTYHIIRSFFVCVISMHHKAKL